MSERAPTSTGNLRKIFANPTADLLEGALFPAGGNGDRVAPI